MHIFISNVVNQNIIGPTADPITHIHTSKKHDVGPDNQPPYSTGNRRCVPMSVVSDIEKKMFAFVDVV